MTKSKSSTQGHRPRGVRRTRGCWAVVRDHEPMTYHSSKEGAAREARRYAETYGYVKVDVIGDFYRNLEGADVWVVPLEVLP